MAPISEQEEFIRLLLGQTDEMIPHIDEMGIADKEGLYGLLNQVAKLSAANIKLLSDTEIRVKLCDYRDQILDSLIDGISEQYTISGEVFAPYHDNWELLGSDYILKDTGIAPYLIANKFGTKANLFFGNKNIDYLHLEYLPGINLFTEDYDSNYDNRRELYFRLISDNYERMDILMLHGPYPATIELLNYYRRLRADGKVYITLDMNSHWQKRIPWSNEVYVAFFSQCNVITNSCRAMRDSMNRDADVSFDGFWIPNGFYNAYNVPIIADPGNKENIILTVGRIGVDEKHNEELLLAFAKIANSIPTWKLHLVGSVDERIKPFISLYFEGFPHLEERVVFTGKIIDKGELYREYAKAKIFVLTSKKEGGTPNVYAEALYHGCSFITSDIDAADDIINYGELGAKYPLGNVDALANALLEMCSKADKKFMVSHIDKALEYANRYYDWSRNAKKIAYMLCH